MGSIGQFIDDAVARHPALMRKVLDRPFGDVRWWLQWDEEGEACGCLIGSMALASGASREAMGWQGGLTPDLVDDVLGRGDDATYDVGCRVAELRHWLARRWSGEIVAGALANARVVDLIKRRIARALARQQAPAAPHAPVVAAYA